MATITLLFPTAGSNNLCCCINHNTHLERYQLTTTTNNDGFSGSGLITLRGIDYDANVNLVAAGDYISGIASLYQPHKRTIINNVLRQQLTSFPKLRIFNEWSGVKAPGFNDNGIVELSDIITTDENIKPFNSAITCVLEATAIRLPMNRVESTKQLSFALDGSDITQWSLITKNNLSMVIFNGASSDTPSSVEFTIDKLSAVLKKGAIQIFGNLITKYSPNIKNNSSTVVSETFSSNYISSVYNSFPWFNKFTMTDTINPTISLVNPTTILPTLSDDLHIVLTLKLVGSI